MYQERDRGAAVTIAVVSGALIGAGVALLFAPKAGQALRGDVAASMGALRAWLAEAEAGWAQQLAAFKDHVERP